MLLPSAAGTAFSIDFPLFMRICRCYQQPVLSDGHRFTCTLATSCNTCKGAWAGNTPAVQGGSQGWQQWPRQLAYSRGKHPVSHLETIIPLESNRSCPLAWVICTSAALLPPPHALH